MSELVLYTSDDGRTRLDLRIEGRTVWLTQLEIAELFQATKQNISLHAKNIFVDGELAENSVVKDSLTTAAGKIYDAQRRTLEKLFSAWPEEAGRARQEEARLNALIAANLAKVKLI